MLEILKIVRELKAMVFKTPYKWIVALNSSHF
jgi:hypothetical protein